MLSTAARARRRLAGPDSDFLLLFSTEARSMPISQELLEILACPKCKGEIHLNPPGDGLVCERCRLMYPIRDDIPVMLIDEAFKLD
jgi:uncharacterized protein YbaR (Trm112 family)